MARRREDNRHARRVYDLLEQVGATLARERKHEIWRLPNGATFVMPASTSDRMSWRASYSDLKKALRQAPPPPPASPEPAAIVETPRLVHHHARPANGPDPGLIWRGGLGQNVPVRLQPRREVPFNLDLISGCRILDGCPEFWQLSPAGRVRAFLRAASFRETNAAFTLAGMRSWAITREQYGLWEAAKAGKAGAQGAYKELAKEVASRPAPRVPALFIFNPEEGTDDVLFLDFQTPTLFGDHVVSFIHTEKAVLRHEAFVWASGMESTRGPVYAAYEVYRAPRLDPDPDWVDPKRTRHVVAELRRRFLAAATPKVVIQ